VLGEPGFCSEECRHAVRTAKDRERKWLLRGIAQGRPECRRELERRRRLSRERERRVEEEWRRRIERHRRRPP
jgi:hypothetical protein